MKTTKADFDLFKKECKKWIDKLNLNNWEYEFSHEFIGDNIVATTESTFKSKMVLIKLNTDIDKFKGSKIVYIKSVAHHEILHVLLENLYHLAIARDFGEGYYLAEEHAVIHRLQKAME